MREPPLDLDALPPFEASYRLLFAPLFHLAFRAVRDRQAAEDVVQDVFVIGHRKYPRFERQGLTAYRRYLWTVCKRLAWRRSRALRRPIEGPPPGSGPNPTRTLALTQALATLDETDYLVVVLYHLEGNTMAEIGAAMGCSAPTVHRTVRTALERLRAALADRADKEGS